MEGETEVPKDMKTDIVNEQADANFGSTSAISEENLSDIESEEGLQMKLGGNRNECNVSLGVRLVYGQSVC